MSDKFSDRMREFGDDFGFPNRAARRKAGLTRAKAEKQGWLPKKQLQIKKPKPKGRPSSK